MLPAATDDRMLIYCPESGHIVNILNILDLYKPPRQKQPNRRQDFDLNLCYDYYHYKEDSLRAVLDHLMNLNFAEENVRR